VGRLDPAEVVELVRLAEADVPGRGGRALHEGEAAFADGVVDFRAAVGELARREVGGEERHALLRGGFRTQERHEAGRGE
jgi:hypothetical protein